jgi:hypothetical protein
MIDQLIEKLEAEIAERKDDISIVENLIYKVIQHSEVTQKHPFSTEVVRLPRFEIIRHIYSDDTFSMGVKTHNDDTRFWRFANGHYLVSDTPLWIIDLREDIHNFLANIEAQAQLSKLNDLIATARILDIDVTPYEAEGVDGLDGQDGREATLC